MKEKLLYLLALVCCLNFVTACSDDDDDDGGGGNGGSKDWTDYVGTFGKDNPLIWNGETIKDESITVKLAKDSNDKPILTITGALWEAPSFSVEGFTIKEANGKYVFNTDTQVTESKIEITGELSPGTVTKLILDPAAQLTITMTREIVADIVGSWDMKYTELPTGASLAAFDIEISELTASMPEVAGMFGMGIGSKIAGKVSDVQIQLSNKGVFSFKWQPVDSEEYKTLYNVIEDKLGADLPGLEQALAFEYYVDGDMVHIGLSKAVIEPLLVMLETVGGNILANIEPYLGLLNILDDGKGYYSIAIKYEKEDDEVRFYMDKELLTPLLTKLQAAEGGGELMGMLSQIQIPIPGGNLTVGDLLGYVSRSETVSLGLTFEK